MMTDKLPATKLRERIEAEISKLSENTESQRQAIYDKFRSVIAGNPKFFHLTEILEETINQVEQLVSIHSPEPVANSEPPPQSRRLSGPVAGIAAAVILAGAAWWFWGPGKINSEFDNGIAGYSNSAENGSEIAETNPRYVAKMNGDDSVLELVGSAPLYRSDFIPVDTTKTYKVTVKIRTLKDDPKAQGATMYVGVATFDADQKLQKTPPGLNRYAAMLARVLKSSDGWVEADGLITGEGNTSFNQFRPGTRFVKPVALINYENPDAISQISYLRFEEVKT